MPCSSSAARSARRRQGGCAAHAGAAPGRDPEARGLVARRADLAVNLRAALEELGLALVQRAHVPLLVAEAVRAERRQPPRRAATSPSASAASSETAQPSRPRHAHGRRLAPLPPGRAARIPWQRASRIRAAAASAGRLGQQDPDALLRTLPHDAACEGEQLRVAVSVLTSRGDRSGRAGTRARAGTAPRRSRSGRGWRGTTRSEVEQGTVGSGGHGAAEAVEHLLAQGLRETALGEPERGESAPRRRSREAPRPNARLGAAHGCEWYKRGDGTTARFFTTEALQALAEGAGLEVEELRYDKRLTVNRAEDAYAARPRRCSRRCGSRATRGGEVHQGGGVAGGPARTRSTWKPFMLSLAVLAGVAAIASLSSRTRLGSWVKAALGERPQAYHPTLAHRCQFAWGCWPGRAVNSQALALPALHSFIYFHKQLNTLLNLNFLRLL